MSVRTLLLVFPLAACAGPAVVAPPGAAFDDAPPRQATLIEGPRVAPPAHDIPEARRREWIDAQRPKVVHEPIVYVPRPEVERVVVREPVRYVRTYDRRDWWAPEFSWSLGWWGGRHHRHGFGWGLGWGERWWW